MLLNFFSFNFSTINKKYSELIIPESFSADGLEFLTSLASFSKKKIPFLSDAKLSYDKEKKESLYRMFFYKLNIEKLKEMILRNPKPFLETESRKIVQKALDYSTTSDWDKFQLISTLMKLPDSMSKFSESKYLKVRLYLGVITSQNILR